MPGSWNDMAEIRRKQIEAGLDLTFSAVFLPYYLQIVYSFRPRRVAEIGCGTGHLSLALIPHVKSLIALEPSRGMYDVAKNVLAATRATLINCRIEDFT